MGDRRPIAWIRAVTQDKGGRRTGTRLSSIECLARPSWHCRATAPSEAFPKPTAALPVNGNRMRALRYVSLTLLARDA